MERKTLTKRESTRNFQFLFKAILFTLLLVAMGQTVSAQSFAHNEAIVEAETAIKVQGSFVETAAALDLLETELENLRNTNPATALEETTNAMKYIFAENASNALRNNQEVEKSLVTAYIAIQGATRNHVNQLPTLPVLDYYVSLLGR